MSRNIITQEEFIDRVTKIFPDYDFSEAVYKGIDEKVEVKCKHGIWWQKPHELFKGFSACKECQKEKRKNTMITRYGYETPFNSEEVRKKSQRTMIERYGAKTPFESKKLKEKIYQTMIKKYGDKNPFKSKAVRDKQRKTMKKKYGVEYPLQNKEFVEKSKKTCIKRYGVENPSQIKKEKNSE